MKPQRTPKRRKPPRRTKAAGAEPAAAPAPAPPPPLITPGAAAQVGGASGLPAPQIQRPVRAGAPRRPARPAARPKPKPVSGGGVSFMTVLLMLVALAIAAMMLKVMLPGDLSDIQGYPKARWADDERNLLAEAQAALLAHDKPYELSELAVNAYLRDRIKGSQGGVFSALVKYQGTYVDIEPGFAEIYVVRTVLGKPFPISSRFSAKDLGGGDFKWTTVDGSVGGLRTGEKQFEPVAKAILRIADTCSHEIDVIRAFSNGGRVVFEKDKVILDPKF